MIRKAFAHLLVALLLTVSLAQAQQPNALRRIGVLVHDGTPPGLLEAFREGLGDLGYFEGKNITIEMRNAAGKNERLGALAEELLQVGVEVILAVNTPSALAAKKATATVPIVMTRVSDPVTTGLVSNLARPGGNVTGLSLNNAELASKNIQLIKDALPGISRVVVLFNARNPAHAPQVVAMKSTSSQLGLGFQSLPVRGPNDFPAAVQAAVKARAEALFVLDDTAVTKHRDKLLELAASHSLPVVSRYKDFPEAGGLFAYGPNLPTVYRRAAYYMDRILRGVKPGDLPIEEPAQFDLVINLKTAKALGLTIPPSVLLIASRVIE